MRRNTVAFLAIGIAAMAMAAETPGAARPGWLGFGYSVHRQATRQWLHVVRLAPGSPADKAGLHVLDVITEANGAPFRFSSDRDALAFFKRFKPGERVILTVVQKGTKKRIAVTAVPMPDSYYALWLRNESLANEKQRAQRP
jgi:C-terminal processing protease CtpA/Prc